MKSKNFEKVMFYLILTLASIIAVFKFHDIANLTRIGNAWGGEVTLILIPLIVYFAISNLRLMKNEK